MEELREDAKRFERELEVMLSKQPPISHDDPLLKHKINSLAEIRATLIKDAEAERERRLKDAEAAREAEREIRLKDAEAAREAEREIRLKDSEAAREAEREIRLKDAEAERERKAKRPHQVQDVTSRDLL